VLGGKSPGEPPGSRPGRGCGTERGAIVIAVAGLLATGVRAQSAGDAEDEARPVPEASASRGGRVPPADGARARLTVRGREILTPGGDPIRLRGFNVLWWVLPDTRGAAAIRKLGANSVRYMFGYKPTGGRFDRSQIPWIAEHVSRFTKQGLWVIPTVHKFEKDGRFPWNSEELQREFLEMWTYVIGELGGNPLVGAWEPINEPHGEVKNAQLRPWYASVIEHIRRLDPGAPIVVEGEGYSHPHRLDDDLKLEAPGIIYAFHMYQPFRYTHQKGDPPPTWPGELGLDYIREKIGVAGDFGRRHDVPIWCGEWGVQTRAAGHSQWLRDVATVLEENEMHWAHWAWAEKKKDPTNGSFDVNPKKVEVYRTMADILASSKGSTVGAGR